MARSRSRVMRRALVAPVAVLAVGLLVVAAGPAVESVADTTSASSSASAPSVGSAPPVQDATSASDAASASVIAQKYGHAVVVNADTTQTEQVVAQPDGSMQLTESSAPVRVQVNGAWTPANETLATGADQMLTPAVSPSPVELSAGGSGALAKIQSPTGQWFSVSWPGGALPAPTVTGATATYAGVFPGVDLQLSATVTGMSEVLVVNNAAAAADPQLQAVDFGLSGATIAVSSGGAAVATGADGSTLVAPAPTWWDSSQSGNAAGPGGGNLARPVAASVSANQIAVDAAVPAATPGVTYPVYVDPDWSTPAPQARTFVDSAYPSQDYFDGNDSDGYMHVGYINAANSDDGNAHTTRSYWQMDTSGVEGKDVSAAQFSTTEDWASSCTPEQVNVYTAGGIGASTTWNAQPTQGGLVTSASMAHGYSSSCPVQAVGFNVLSAVQAAATISQPLVRFELKAADETNWLAWKKFSGVASLTVTYNSYPNAPTAPVFTAPPRGCGTATAPVYINSGSSLTMQVDSTDPDAGQNVSTRFYVVNAHNGADNELSASTYPAGYAATPLQAQGNASEQINPALLGSDTTFYAWDAQTYDGTDVSVARTPYCYFQVKNTGPASLPVICGTGTGCPTVVSQAVGQATTQVTFSSDVSDDVAVFGYWIMPNAPVSTPTLPATGLTGSSGIPACNSTVGLVHFVCADASGVSPVVNVAPINTTSALYVISYDKAMNIDALSSNTSLHAAGVALYGQPDTANISYTTNSTAGHGWLMENGASNPNPLPDSNLTLNPTSGGALPLTIGAGTGQVVLPGPLVPATGLPYPPVISDLSGSDALSLPGYYELDRVFNNTTHSAVLESAYPSGFHLEQALGQVAPDETTGATVSVYSCALSSGNMSSTSSTCEGAGATGVQLGYAWGSPSASPPTVAIYRCHTSSGDHFDSTLSNCEGYTNDGVGPMFYLANIVSTKTMSPALADTTESFTVGAYVYPAAAPVDGKTYVLLSQQGTTNSAFYLEETIGSTGLGTFQFCVQSQISTVKACATTPAPAASADTWVYLTGVWDAANQQVRIMTNGNWVSGASAIVPFDVAGNTATTGPFVVGSGWTNGAPSSQWNGFIDDPSVFPGVADTDELGDLEYGGTSNP
jgi:hypothetical protein